MSLALVGLAGLGLVGIGGIVAGLRANPRHRRGDNRADSGGDAGFVATDSTLAMLDFT